MAPYPLRTTLLAFADDMAVVTATARRPLPTTPDPARATRVLHIVTIYLEGNQLLVHNVKSATMVHNAPPPPLRPGDLPMDPVNTATLRGQTSPLPPQPGWTDSRINLCYADPAPVEVTWTRHHNMPSTTTGHRSLEVQLKLCQVPRTLSDDTDQDEQPPISPPHKHTTHKWMAYYRTVDRVLGQQAKPDLNREEPSHAGGRNPTLGLTLYSQRHIA